MLYEFSQISLSISRLAEQLTAPSSPEFVHKGNLVLAYEEHCHWWCRALVADVVEGTDEQMVDVYFADLGHSSLVPFDCIRVIVRSQQADEVVAINCAHFPLIIPELNLAKTFDERQFVSSLQNFTFELDLFALLRSELNDFYEGHQGISAYLGTATVLERPFDAPSSAPTEGTSLGNFMFMNVFAFSEPFAENFERLMLSCKRPKTFGTMAIAVETSHFVKPNTVWVQRRSSASLQSILSMQKRISEIAEAEPEMKSSEIITGMPLLVNWPLDSKWYRAICTQAPSTEYVCVYFVDYGNTDHVPISCCRVAPTKIHQAPPFCTKAKVVDSFARTIEKKNLEKAMKTLQCYMQLTDIKSPDGLPVFEVLTDNPLNSNEYIPYA